MSEAELPRSAIITRQHLFNTTRATSTLGEFKMRGSALREKGLNRAGNILIPNDNYCAFEDWLMPILDSCLEEQQRAENPVSWTPSKVSVEVYLLLEYCWKNCFSSF